MSHSKQTSYTVFAIGDAAHGLPIVKSNGANMAMNDAAGLDHWLAHHLSRSQDKAANFYKDSDAYKTWYREARDALQRLRQMHGQQKLSNMKLDEVIGFSYADAAQDHSHDSSGSDSEADGGTMGKL